MVTRLKEWNHNQQILFALMIFEIMTGEEWISYYFAHCGDKMPVCECSVN